MSWFGHAYVIGFVRRRRQLSAFGDAVRPQTFPGRSQCILQPVRFAIVFLSACVAGAINSVAGGGTLVTFPTLVWLGIPGLNANATNAVALMPGNFAGAWGYRRELGEADPRLLALLVPSLAGGLIGAVLLALTPSDVFDALIPVLILFATCLFMVQEPLQRRFNLAMREGESQWRSWTMLFQFLVGVYGGYFGAGIGILMLAALSLMGHTDIHQMNGVKSLMSGAMNGIAAVYFVVLTDLVVWQDAGSMAIGAIVGSIGAAGLARRLDQQVVRRIVVAVGFVMAFSMMLGL
jgi:uncharacterized protein